MGSTQVLSFEQIMSMLDAGIIGEKFRHPPFEFGFRNGHYLGAPGKDIYWCLYEFTDEEMVKCANKLASLYPTKPPGNHVKWAACIRYIYGCFEKQGCLRSRADKNRMIEENPNWSKPTEFMDKVRKCFEKSGNNYGLILHYEMLGHRIGDRIIIDNDLSRTPEMILTYRKSQSLSKKVKSWKHTFTPFYWCAKYLFETGQKELAKTYYQKCLRNMEKYCPDARQGYREKATTAIRNYKACASREEYSDLKKWLASCKNRCLVKVR